MDLKDKHLAEEELQNLINEVKSLLDKCEIQYIADSEIEDLKYIRKKIFDLEMKRLSTFINKYGKLDPMPADEEKLLREMSDLLLRMNKIIGDADFL